MKTAILDVELSDTTADRVRRSHGRAINELQRNPVPQAIPGVVLKSGVATPVPHRLGRLPLMVQVSPPRAAGLLTSGCVQEIRSNTGIDRTKIVMLMAAGFGADITVDVTVF